MPTILARGDRVVATARAPEKIAHLAGERCRTLRLDVTDAPDAIAAVAREAVGVWGRVDVLVNNAGLAKNFLPKLPGPGEVDIKKYQEMLWNAGTPQDFSDAFDVNVSAVWYNAVCFLDLLAERRAVRAAETRVLHHDHGVCASGERPAGVDAEDAAGREWRREQVRAGGEDGVYSGRVRCCNKDGH